MFFASPGAGDREAAFGCPAAGAGDGGAAAAAMKHAGATIAEIAYLHSDAAFLFPIVPEAPFGAELLALADAQRPNAHGRPCRVHGTAPAE